MSLQARIESLNKEHDRLDDLIAQELSHPASAIWSLPK